MEPIRLPSRRAFAITHACREQERHLIKMGGNWGPTGDARRAMWLSPNRLRHLPNRGWRTLSPIFKPIRAAVPALTSRTP